MTSVAAGHHFLGPWKAPQPDSCIRQDCSLLQILRGSPHYTRDEGVCKRRRLQLASLICSWAWHSNNPLNSHVLPQHWADQRESEQRWQVGECMLLKVEGSQPAVATRWGPVIEGKSGSSGQIEIPHSAATAAAACNPHSICRLCDLRMHTAWHECHSC